MKSIFPFLLLSAALLAGCATRDDAPGKAISRPASFSSAVVAEEVVSGLLSDPMLVEQLNSWKGQHGGKAPSVIVNPIENHSLERGKIHILQTTRDAIERRLVLSQQFDILSDPDSRSAFRLAGVFRTFSDDTRTTESYWFKLLDTETLSVVWSDSFEYQFSK